MKVRMPQKDYYYTNKKPKEGNPQKENQYQMNTSFDDKESPDDDFDQNIFD